MNELSGRFSRLLDTPDGVCELAAMVVISLCVVAVFAAVFINFVSCSRRKDVKQERRSIVATGSMTLFFVLVYVLIHLQVGVLPVTDPRLRIGMVVAGLAVIVMGCAVNIMGRLHLGRNWANQATVYSDQTLTVSGVYSLVRHPLYASLIWMFYGASIVYANVAAFLATSLIFVPFMFHRTLLEEDLLAREFKEYEEYRERVGMFFPNLFRARRAPAGGPKS